MGIDEGVYWVPDACTLPTVERPLRVAEFDDLVAVVQRTTRPQPGRLDLVMPRDAEAMARRLAELESECCSFFAFAFEPAGADVVMRISVPAQHVEVLDALDARVAAAGSDRS